MIWCSELMIWPSDLMIWCSDLTRRYMVTRKYDTLIRQPVWYDVPIWLANLRKCKSNTPTLTHSRTHTRTHTAKSRLSDHRSREIVCSSANSSRFLLYNYPSSQYAPPKHPINLTPNPGPLPCFESRGHPPVTLFENTKLRRQHSSIKYQKISEIDFESYLRTFKLTRTGKSLKSDIFGHLLGIFGIFQVFRGFFSG